MRLIIATADYGAAANIGGPVDQTVRTFDFELPEAEAHLQEHKDALTKALALKQTLWMTRTVIGVEIISKP